MKWLKQYQYELFIFLVLLACYSYFLPRWADWNQNSRLNLVLAIIDNHTLNIDNYYENTGDYAFYNGHYYSDKAPGISFLGVPVYAIVKPALQSNSAQSLFARIANSNSFEGTLNESGTGLLTKKVYFAVVLYILTVVIVAVPSALLGVLIYRFLSIFTISPGPRISTVLIYGLATNVFPYSGSFFGHLVVAFLLFSSFYLAFLISQQVVSSKWVIPIGLMLGYAVITEYPVVLIAGAVFIYTLIVLPKKWWGVVGLVLAGIPPGLLLISYNWSIFNTIFPVGYKYSTLYQDIHGQGFLSLVGPNLPALWGITFGSFRGLFFIAPVMLLGVIGFYVWWKQKTFRLEWLICLWAVFSFFMFNGSSIMWQGGFSIGPRYLLPMMPFFATALGAFICIWGTRYWWAKILIISLGIWSLIVVWAETLGGQSFPDWTPNPLFNYSIPNLFNNDIARNLGMVLGLHGWASLVPLLVFLILSTVFVLHQIKSADIYGNNIPIIGKREKLTYEVTSKN